MKKLILSATLFLSVQCIIPLLKQTAPRHAPKGNTAEQEIAQRFQTCFAQTLQTHSERY